MGIPFEYRYIYSYIARAGLSNRVSTRKYLTCLEGLIMKVAISQCRGERVERISSRKWMGGDTHAGKGESLACAYFRGKPSGRPEL